MRQGGTGTRSRSSRSGRHAAVPLVAAAAVASLAIGPLPPPGPDIVVPPTVPPGITLVEVRRDLIGSSDELLWTRLGDAEGRTLLFGDADPPGVATCVDDCASQFPPLLAPDGTEAFGHWSLVRRPDAGMQWAYQSRPLYTWSAEQEPGEVATNVGLAETTGSKVSEGLIPAGTLMPPEGWHVARFDPAVSTPVPDGIEVRLVASAHAVILTDFNGRTLYAFDGDATDDGQTCSDHGCDIRWSPVAAAQLAMEVGYFSVVTRTDGSRQWAYRQQPLYRYAGDLLPGDVHGDDADPRWRVAVLTRNFRPPQVAVTSLEGYGDVLSIDGMSLYMGTAFEKYWGGRSMRDSFRVLYSRGKRLGGGACVGDECLETWRPFPAPADAESNGFWEVITRRDGSRQWAYKGFALYTFSGDEAPGQHRGQATYSFVELDESPANLERATWLAFVGSAGGGAGVYWNIAKP